MKAVEVLPEEGLREVVDQVVLVVEAVGVVVIVVGVLVALAQLARVAPRQGSRGFSSVRLVLGRFLALGLEFQLAADILTTAVAPSFEELGKLAAVAAIRTALNVFLAKEIREEQRAEERPERPARP